MCRTYRRGYGEDRLRKHGILGIVIAVTCAAAALLLLFGRGYGLSPGDSAQVTGIHKIKHVITIMQENRSFDSYFGTFPGRGRNPHAQWRTGRLCERPRHRPVREAVSRCQRPERRRSARRTRGKSRCGWRTRWTALSHGPSRAPAGVWTPTTRPARNCAKPDVMGYHDGGDIPKLLEYAREFRAARSHVRAKRLLEPARASVPGLGMVGDLYETRRSVSVARMPWTSPVCRQTFRSGEENPVGRPSMPGPI